MTKTIIRPKASAPAAGPYSHGVRIGDFLFSAGQIPIVPETGQVLTGDIGLQTKRALENIKLILEDQGIGMANIVKTTVFMTDLGQFPKMNEAYAEFFTSNFPARSTVQVSALPRGAQVEIEVIAHF
jgi:2-iminobutanoate/2-iminopropanoate deaminase